VRRFVTHNRAARGAPGASRGAAGWPRRAAGSLRGAGREVGPRRALARRAVERQHGRYTVPGGVHVAHRQRVTERQRSAAARRRGHLCERRQHLQPHVALHQPRHVHVAALAGPAAAQLRARAAQEVAGRRVSRQAAAGARSARAPGDEGGITVQVEDEEACVLQRRRGRDVELRPGPEVGHQALRVGGASQLGRAAQREQQGGGSEREQAAQRAARRRRRRRRRRRAARAGGGGGRGGPAGGEAATGARARRHGAGDGRTTARPKQAALRCVLAPSRKL